MLEYNLELPCEKMRQSYRLFLEPKGRGRWKKLP
jgi:hypothetical protein